MKRKSSLTIILIFIFSFSAIFSQKSNTTVQDVEVQVSYAKFIGKTPQVRHLVPLAPTSQEKRQLNKNRKKEIPNFVGRKQRPILNPDAKPTGADPVRQTSANKSLGLVIEPSVNMDGLISNFGTPHDPTGDIGMDYYIQGINSTTFKVFDKTGSAVSGNISANTLWSSIGFSSAGDPIILYDHEMDRWILTEFPNGNQLLFGISETNDPLGSWLVYNFGTPSFPDYPKYSIWNNAYVATTNEQGPGVLPAYFIDRQAMLNGDAMVPIQRVQIPGLSGAPGFFVGTPVDWTGDNSPPTGANPMILRLNDDGWGTTAQDQIDIFSVEIDWDDANNTVVTMTSAVTAPFDTNPCSASGPGFACIPQQGGSGIDGLPEVIMHQVHYRNFGAHESMVLNFITDATGTDVSGIRWMELRRTPGNDWSVYQEGTYAPDDGLHRFMAGICMDVSGNIGLAYSVSSPDIHPGIRFTGRRAGDPLGEMTVDEYIAVEGTSTNPSHRFGDYAQMSVDPVNQRTFWFTGEYMGNGGARTRIVAFELGRDTTDIGPTALITPQNSPDLTSDETVEIQIKNYGLDTQSVYNVGYILNNGTEVLEPVNFTLYPDSTYNHIFTPTVDLSVVGLYDFTIFTVLADDDAIFNDTLRFTVEKFPRWDAGITGMEGLDGVLCGDTIPASVVLTNFGTEELTEVSIDIYLNGNPFQSFLWAGNLVPGGSVEIPFTLTGYLDGNNEILATSSNPDGMTDEVMANDTYSRTFDAILDGVSIVLQLLTDEYSEETTWELTNDNGTILYSGGPYSASFTLHEEEFCLDPSECYTFTIFDSFGDGICCDYGNGNYSIVDAEGLPLLTSTGDFGFQESNDFCATFSCALEADVDISLESEAGANDGVILIFALNAIGLVQYSIDGGQNFHPWNIFSNLAGGDYAIVVMDEAGCLFESIVTVPTCVIEATAEVMNEVGDSTMNGQIEINVTTGNPPYEYSLDGSNWQTDTLFTDLSTGNYTVYIRDSAGCAIEINVFVDFQTDTKEFLFGQTIEVFPNPTDGVFRINVKGLDRADIFLPFQIYDVSGKLVQESQLVKYDDTFTGQASLVVYPAGTYFIRFLDEKMDRLIRMVKQ